MTVIDYRKELLVYHILKILDVNVKSSEEINSRTEEMISSLIVLPHLVVESATHFPNVEQSLSRIIVGVVEEFTDLSSVPQLLLLNRAMSASYIAFGKTTTEMDIQKCCSILENVIKTNILALRTLDICVNTLEFNISQETLTKVKTVLEHNLASPFHQVNFASELVLIIASMEDCVL